MMDEPALDVTPGRVYLYTALGGRVLDTLVYDGVLSARQIKEPPETGNFGFILCSKTSPDGAKTVKLSLPVRVSDGIVSAADGEWVACQLVVDEAVTGVLIICELSSIEVPFH